MAVNQVQVFFYTCDRCGRNELAYGSETNYPIALVPPLGWKVVEVEMPHTPIVRKYHYCRGCAKHVED